MDKNRIAIATMTWGRDEREESLLRESLSILAQAEIATFVADGGSRREFLQFLRNFSNFHTFDAASSGVFPQVKHSLRAAARSEADFIFYTEPDKNFFFESKLLDFFAAAPPDENVGIVLAARSTDSFATFPEFQQYTETVVNNLCAEIISEQGDYTYGPFLFNRKLAGYLNLANDNLGWGWRPFLFSMAKRKGYKIVRLENDYPCPLEQREDSQSERIYRMKQLSENIEGLVLSAKISLPDD